VFVCGDVFICACFCVIWRWVMGVCDVVWVCAGVFVGCLLHFSPFIVCTSVFGGDVIL
jgi:hypothetical protein